MFILIRIICTANASINDTQNINNPNLLKVPAVDLEPKAKYPHKLIFKPNVKDVIGNFMIAEECRIRTNKKKRLNKNESDC